MDACGFTHFGHGDDGEERSLRHGDIPKEEDEKKEGGRGDEGFFAQK